MKILSTVNIDFYLFGISALEGALQQLKSMSPPVSWAIFGHPASRH